MDGNYGSKVLNLELIFWAKFFFFFFFFFYIVPSASSKQMELWPKLRACVRTWQPCQCHQHMQIMLLISVLAGTGRPFKHLHVYLKEIPTYTETWVVETNAFLHLVQSCSFCWNGGEWNLTEGGGGKRERAHLIKVLHFLGTLPLIQWRPLIPTFDPWLLQWTESHKYRRPK